MKILEQASPVKRFPGYNKKAEVKAFPSASQGSSFPLEEKCSPNSCSGGSASQEPEEVQQDSKALLEELECFVKGTGTFGTFPLVVVSPALLVKRFTQLLKGTVFTTNSRS